MESRSVRRGRRIALLSAASVAAGLTGRAWGYSYDAITGLGVIATSSTDYAQQITLSGPNEQYDISSINLDLDWYNISAGSQSVTLGFYTNANLSSTTSNALGNALYIGGGILDLTAPTADGLRGYSISLGGGVEVPSGTFTLQVLLQNAAGTGPSTGLGGAFSAGTPAVGSNPGFLWSDSNNDGIFEGSEQSTTSLGTNFNIPVQVNATGVTPTAYQWNTPAGGNWETTTDWNPNGTPAPGDSVLFNLSSAAGYTVGINASDSCRSLTVGSDRVTLALNGSSAGLSVYGTLTVGQQTAGAAGNNHGVLTLTEPAGAAQPVAVAAANVIVGWNGGTGVLTVGPNVTLQSLNNTTIGPGSLLTVQNYGTLLTNSLTLAGSTNAWTGKLDIGYGSLDIPTGSLATITNQVKEGYNLTGGANWNGPGGITSTAAATDSTHLTAVGVIQNNQSGTAIYGQDNLFEGSVAPGPGDILVAYTYFGDANLDGTVDGSDYSLIDNGYASNQPGFKGTVLSGWYNGDFNYDGVIDGSDYALIDNSFNNQSPYGVPADLQAVANAVQSGAVSVPEPGSIGVVLFGGVAVWRRRRARPDGERPVSR